MIAPVTAPQILPVLEIPAPKPHATFFAVSGSRSRSLENAEKTAAEQVNLLMKHWNASSDFVIALQELLPQNHIKQVARQGERH